MFRFEIIHQSHKSNARVGRIHTPHGVIDTPGFVPVGTHAATKMLDSKTVEDLGTQLLFCNTYHLMLHPGSDVVREAGGLHTFMNRNQPIITDSGGFQVFSLAYGSVQDELKSRGMKKHDSSIIKINENGVVFRSYRDGQYITLTPETSVQAQKDLGADIIIPLDELPAYHTDARKLKASLDRTHRWEQRSLDEHLRNPQQQAMYGVIHGGIDPDMRKHSCDVICNMGFDGFAIGGSLGKTHDEMVTMLQTMQPHVPDDKPRHLLGIGDIAGIDATIPLGMDTFDSSYPTKCARHGMLLHDDGPIKIYQTKWKRHFHSISDAPVIREYTASYIHHLFKAHESLGPILASIHNINYMHQRMRRYRELILDNAI